ncbi:MAG TPA: DUF1552 domain-containing protein [Bryobacteraceae bacterium]|nr:DUF1552 domain-containing protein [Bryobacteraceae bacterium]
MIVTKNSIDRRTVLRGLGVTVALPLLDAMVPALTAFQKTAAKPVNRFGAVYVPNGIMMRQWTPEAEGDAFEFTPTLKPLEPFRDRLLVLSGLNSTPPAKQGAVGVHARASTRFLTDTPPKSTNGGDLEAGISMDQIAAQELGRHTQLASLELGLESTESAASCDNGFNCVYTSTISWRGPTTPLPAEHNPREVFERMFGDATSTDPATRMARIQQERSILDSVSQRISRLGQQVGSGDRAKLDEYFEAIRDVERRIQNAEQQSARELPVLDHPPGIPAAFEDHAKLMYDLYALAYQCDLTRVITFMIAHEFSGRTYPEIGVPDAHHPISHHQNDPGRLAKLAKINNYHVTLFAYFLEKLRSTPDGDGSLLDHTTIVYGAGMSDSNAHDPKNLPILLAGGGAGTLKSGRHLRFAKDTPLANLHVTLLDKLGVHVEKLGDSAGELSQLSTV